MTRDEAQAIYWHKRQIREQQAAARERNRRIRAEAMQADTPIETLSLESNSIVQWLVFGVVGTTVVCLIYALV